MLGIEDGEARLRIAIVGAGRVGSALGRRWHDTGHQIVYGVREPQDPRHAALAGEAALPAEAIRAAEVVLLALPWSEVEAVTSSLDFVDAIVIDATNPLGPSARELSRSGDADVSGAERVAAWTGSTRVVKAFNTTGSGNMADPAYGGPEPWMPVCGDDDDAKQVVLDLARQIGFDAIDAGPLSSAVDLEHLAALWIRLAYGLGNGPDIAFALLRR